MKTLTQLIINACHAKVLQYNGKLSLIIMFIGLVYFGATLIMDMVGDVVGHELLHGKARGLIAVVCLVWVLVQWWLCVRFRKLRKSDYKYGFVNVTLISYTALRKNFEKIMEHNKVDCSMHSGMYTHPTANMLWNLYRGQAENIGYVKECSRDTVINGE